MRARLSVFLLLLVAACGARGVPRPGVVIYGNAVIYTGEPGDKTFEAMAVRAGRIQALGWESNLLDIYEGARRVDLGGACVVPGFIDAHGHLAALGALKGELDLRAATSYDEVLRRVQARAKQLPQGAWIRGGRWDEATWGQKEFPTHVALSKITPDHPVLLSRVDGHAALANRRALDMAGITRDTKDPAGGEILRDENGDPTGMLIDSAVGLVRAHIPSDAGQPIGELWEVAQKACFAVGITGVHDAGVSPDDLATLRGLFAEGILKLRVHAMLSDGKGMAEYLARNKPVRDLRFNVRAVKFYVDGAMGSRGAWMLEPYADRPAHAGLSQMPVERIRQLATVAVQKGWQVCTHAIGDRANREVLDAYEAAGVTARHRFRIEHAQCVHEDDMLRFAKLGVIASMQPTHATSDMRWAEDRVGPSRIARCYAWRSLLSQHVRLAFGSDFPVESENPLWGFYAAITRQDHDGNPPEGWRPAERLPRDVALRLFTLDAAYAAFQESHMGSLRAGKHADFVVLDHDIMKVPEPQILVTRVLRTVIEGETVYEAR